MLNLIYFQKIIKGKELENLMKELGALISNKPTCFKAVYPLVEEEEIYI